jgi:hypothetical protein
VIPPLFIISPARMKKGIAMMGKESTAENIFVTTIMGESPPTKRASRDAIPMAYATGVLIAIKTMNEMNNTASIMSFRS